MNNPAARPHRQALAAALAAFALLLPATTLLAARPALEQQRAPADRVAQGTVVDHDDKPVPGAIVYLKDTHSNAVKTYIADTDGHFRFGELSQSTDYDLWADSNGHRSKTKGISSFDNNNNLNYTLKLEK